MEDQSNVKQPSLWLCLSIVLFLVKYCSVYCCIKRFIGNKVKISFTISAVSSNRLKFIC